ncbi:tRNA (adenosine(37)-N6)-threonylcarbamoyltransferase complex ATPase subunit type 1 TsaE [Sulfurospirillum multivorans]|uniref:tRNA threonylcarbamoyladenosine biosynthesis protein TsaE n=2 Tax=Sulfurospirillum multivorans TaxID=66821 RepID=A0AA86ALQ4_SULMK|nr:tRNA (adenosine(37)-N6)-threonylcarbamoyltransferase complex ATPase subunit type 1 TsaE [Sulfurospirillum multivorans]AHJ12764.1 ATPase YjeE/YdiB-like [Sulfurospirillum multivorans DSM 12446]QEH06259.1 ATPase YjeE/YdiB-like [Sulfurospirillum multivorans]
MSQCYEKVCDLAHLIAFAEEIKNKLGNSGVLLLRGNLASGKTAFVKAFAKTLGLEEAISSPTFSILHEYDEKLFHYDIYQCGSNGFLQSGLIEKLDVEGYHLIEWGDAEFEKLLHHFGVEYSTIDIETMDLKRNYKVHINAYA